MQVGFKTDKGICRVKNEDACTVLLPSKVFVVCDGVGGGNAGEIASRTSVVEIKEYLDNNPIPKENIDSVISYFNDCIKKINGSIFRKALSYRENTGMATTLALLYINKDKALICNVGDSRVYVYRKGKYKQLTEDHTYVNSLVKAGIITKEEAKTDSRRNMITRAVGAEPDVAIDFFQLDIEKDDVFILCSDGLYNEVSDQEIVKVIKNSNTMSEVCKELVIKANLNGGHDNITIVTVKVSEEDLNE